MRSTELLPIGELAHRAGLAPSALRYYERAGLIVSARTGGGQRRYERGVLRRLAFIRAAQNVGLSLDEIRSALATLPAQRSLTRADWARLSRSWQARLDEQIAGLTQLRDGLTSCIGCGCLSLKRCALSNPDDAAAALGPGARFLSKALRRTPSTSNATKAEPTAMIRSPDRGVTSPTADHPVGHEMIR